MLDAFDITSNNGLDFFPNGLSEISQATRDDFDTIVANRKTKGHTATYTAAFWQKIAITKLCGQAKPIVAIEQKN